MKNKMKRFLAGLCTGLMLFQGIAESGFVLYAQAGEEVRDVTDAVTDEEAVSADEAVSRNAVSDNDTVSKDTVSADSSVSEDVSENEEEETTDIPIDDEDDLPKAGGPEITGGKMYEPSTGNYLGTFNEATGEAVIAANLETVPLFVFNGWDEIKKLSFEKGSIASTLGQANPNGAFQKCENLEEVDLSNATNLTTIKYYSFEGCISLKKVIFNEKLNHIENNAFSNCKQLDDVVFEKELSILGNDAFQGCSNLHKITIKGTKFKSAAPGTFAGCAISSFTLAKDEKSGCSIFPESLFDRATFDETATIEIDADVVEIGKFAFRNSNITKVTLPGEKLTTIDEEAFSGCTKLEAIDFSGCTGLHSIEARAFRSCEKIPELVLPDNITFIGDGAFAGCKAVTTLTLSKGTQTKENLGTAIFDACESLQRVEFPREHQYISEREFNGCTSLKEVVFSENIKEIGAGAFAACKSLTTIELPDSLEKMGDNCFANCWVLSKVVLPVNDVFDTIPNGCFLECYKLHDLVLIEGIKFIGDSAFKWCNAFYSTLPSTLEHIGSNAFNTCGFYGELVLPAKLDYIGSAAFKSCADHLGYDGHKKLSVIKILPRDITTCGEQIFNECYISAIELPEGVTRIPANLFNQTTWQTGTTLTIPNTVEEIGKCAFLGNSVENSGNLKAIVFEEGSNLKKIEDDAFKGNVIVEDIVLPDKLETIGARAFFACTSLKNITIPESVIFIGESAFESCSKLEIVAFNAISANSCGRNIFLKCNIKAITIGEKVSVFPDYLFYGAQFQKKESGDYYLVELTVPASVKKIGDYSLTNVVNLERIIFEEGSRLEEIGQYALSGCDRLKGIDLPESLVKINNYAFMNCDALKDIVLPENLETLGAGALKECVSITAVTIPAKITIVDRETFSGCSALSSLVFAGKNVTTIGDYAFYNCSQLKSVTIPNGVKQIGACAFQGCPIEGTLRIPDGVLTIGNNAFDTAGKSGKTIVYLPSSVTGIGTGAFNKEYASNLEFRVVPGSYAEKWLKDNGFTIVNMLTITYVLFEDNSSPNKPDNGGNPYSYEVGDKTVLAPGNWAGYDFEGWYLDEAYTKPITSLEGQTTDLTIYAKWTILSYKITYVLNGGVNDEENPSEYTTATAYNLKDAKKEGYRFAGWYTDLADEKTRVTGLKGMFGDLTLYASWDGGTVEVPMSSIREGEVREGTAIKLSSATIGATIYYTTDGTNPAYTGIPFKKASSKPSGTTKEYTEAITVPSAASFVIKAIAVKDDSKDSPIVSFTYTVIDENGYWGDVSEGDRTGFKDASEVPNGIWVRGIEEAVFTGDAVTFNIRVYDGKTRLVKDTDYSVKYKNNKNAGKASDKKAPTVIIAGKGNYSKKKITQTFTIVPRDISGTEFKVNDLYLAGGKKVKPVPELYFGNTKLKNKKDFTVEPAVISSEGTLELTITGVKNYTGSRKINCTVKNGKSIAKAKVEGFVKTIPYDAADRKQNLTIKLGKTILTYGTDYELEYIGIDGPGTATVIIKGVGSYSGEKRMDYTIGGEVTLTEANVNAVVVLDNSGKVVDVSVTVKDGSTILTEGADYTLTKPAVIKAGTSKVTVSGKGKYGGIVKKVIDGADISVASYVFINADGSENASGQFGMRVGGVKPKIALTLGGVKLVKNVDYTTSYENNEVLGNATLVITGKGRYSGTLRAGYTIVKQDLSELFGYATDVAYKAKGGMVYTSKLSIYDVRGNVLGKECYDVKYTYTNASVLVNGTPKNPGEEVASSDVVADGTIITVAATGKGDYTGTFLYQIKVGGKSIAKAKFKVKDQIYTGSPIEPGKSDITVKKITDADYEIIGCITNVAKGKGKLIVRGIGEYSGTKVVTFKIKQKEFVEAR